MSNSTNYLGVFHLYHHWHLFLPLCWLFLFLFFLFVRWLLCFCVLKFHRCPVVSTAILLILHTFWPTLLIFSGSAHSSQFLFILFFFQFFAQVYAKTACLRVSYSSFPLVISMLLILFDCVSSSSAHIHLYGTLFETWNFVESVVFRLLVPLILRLSYQRYRIRRPDLFSLTWLFEFLQLLRYFFFLL